MPHSSKTEILSLPEGLDAMYLKIKELITLPHLTELKITPEDLTVTRAVEEGEQVIPDKSFDKFVDPEVILLERIELIEVDQSEERHPLLVLADAFALISAQSMQARWILEPEAGLAAAYFGVDTHFVYGMEPVGISDNFDDRIILVCGPTQYLSDATIGVIVSVQ